MVRLRNVRHRVSKSYYSSLGKIRISDSPAEESWGPQAWGVTLRFVTSAISDAPQTYSAGTSAVAQLGNAGTSGSSA